MIDISDSLSIEGWMSEAELAWLAQTAQKHSVCVEVGSWKGRSSLAIAKHTLGVLYCVDAWVGMLDIPSGEKDHAARIEATRAELEFHKNLDEYVLAKKVKIVKEDSINAAVLLLKAFGGESFDWVFLDGDHYYETVKAEIAAYRPLLKPGGLLSGHDYYHDGVWRAVHELASDHKCIDDGNIWYAEV